MSLKKELHDESIEQAVIAGLISKNDVIYENINDLDEKYFFFPINQLLISTIKKIIVDDNSKADLVTINSELKDNDIYKKFGSVVYLTGIVDSYFLSANMALHLKKLKSLYQLRELKSLSTDILTSVNDADVATEDILPDIENKLFEISKSDNKKGLVDIRKAASNLIDELQHSMTHGVDTVYSNYTKIDDTLHGFHKANLIILAARPGVGKTSMVINLMINIANAGKKVAFFSLEMSETDITGKIVSCLSGIDYSLIRARKIKKDDIDTMMSAIIRLKDYKISIDDSAGLSTGEIKSKAMKMKMTSGLDIIFIDYLQLIQPKGNRRNVSRNEEITYISAALKEIAKSLDVPVVVLSQLSREVERRTNKRPMLSDLRDSGAIEQDADIVSFLYRESYYDKDAESLDTEFIIAKNRHGDTGIAFFDYDKKASKFIEKNVS